MRSRPWVATDAARRCVDMPSNEQRWAATDGAVTSSAMTSAAYGVT